MEKKETKKEKTFYKKWWFWIIIVLVIIISILITIIIFDSLKTKDNTDLSSYEVMKYLEDKGYIFEIKDDSYIYKTHYIIIKNNNEGIWIQQYQNELIGTNTSFKNSSCNDEFADISSESANETEDEKKQYKAYVNWLNDMGLSKSQIIEVIDYYDTLEK